MSNEFFSISILLSSTMSFLSSCFGHGSNLCHPPPHRCAPIILNQAYSQKKATQMFFPQSDALIGKCHFHNLFINVIPIIIFWHYFCLFVAKMQIDSDFEQIKIYDLNRTLFDWILLALTGLSNALQLFTILMILCKSPEFMHEYRFYLFGVTFSDLVFNFTIGFIIMPKLWMPDSLGCHAIGLAAFFGPNGGRFAYCLAAFALSCQLLFQLFSTVYRMASVLGMEHPKLLSRITRNSSKIWMVLICWIIAGSIAYISFVTTITREGAFVWHFDGYNNRIPPFNAKINESKCCLNLSKEMDEILNEQNLLETLEEFKPAIMPNRLEPDGMEEILTMPDEIRGRVEFTIRADKNYTNEMAHILNAVRAGYPLIYIDYLKSSFMVMCTFYYGFILIGQAICLYASLKIIRYLRQRQRKFSTQTYQLQMQLIILLIIQILQPFLLLCIPITFVLLSLIELNISTHFNILRGENQAGNFFFGIHSRLFAESTILLLIAYSIVNSILINCFVGAYRREIALIWGKLWKMMAKTLAQLLIRKIWRRLNIIQPLPSMNIL